MSHTRTALFASAAVCLVAVATPAVAQGASAAQGHTANATKALKVRQAKYAIPATATAEIGDSGCRLETFYVSGITQPNYTTMCGPR